MSVRIVLCLGVEFLCCLHPMHVFDCMEITTSKDRLCCAMAHMNRTSVLKT